MTNHNDGHLLGAPPAVSTEASHYPDRLRYSELHTSSEAIISWQLFTNKELHQLTITTVS